MALHNRVNNKILKAKLSAQSQKRLTLSFYCYHTITNPEDFRNKLYKDLNAIGVLGRVYIAHEGINAQVSVPQEHQTEFTGLIREIPWLYTVRINYAIEDDGKSFFKLKVQLKKKIVADGISDPSFDASHSGKHLSAAAFNTLAQKPDTLIVDMRNHYESEVGRFKNAICPDADTFRDALPMVERILAEKKEKDIVLYCTGGIRCEKASAWMKHRGFPNVYQLEGGIIEYVKQAKTEGLENLFVGKNFVFDERLGERISDDILSTCHQCGEPCDIQTNCKNDGCHLLFIQCAKCAEKFSGCCSGSCKETISLPSDVQKELRRGKAQGRQVFRKGRSGHLLQS